MATQEQQLEDAFNKAAINNTSRLSRTTAFWVLGIAGLIGSFSIPAYAAVFIGLFSADCLFCFLRAMI